MVHPRYKGISEEVAYGGVYSSYGADSDNVIGIIYLVWRCQCAYQTWSDHLIYKIINIHEGEELYWNLLDYACKPIFSRRKYVIVVRLSRYIGHGK